MTKLYLPPRLLEPHHDIDQFLCRSDEQTWWLRHHARQAGTMGTAKVLIVTRPCNVEVVAYYAWCMGRIRIADAPNRLRTGAGRYPQPVALLTRLGVSIRHERRGLGTGLLQDVIGRTAQLGTEIGCRGLLVHAETTEARDFYLHLVLFMKDLHKALRSGGGLPESGREAVHDG